MNRRTEVPASARDRSFESFAMHPFYARLNEHLVELAAAASGPRPRRVVDVACGTGAVTVQLARRFPEAELVGVEPSDEALERARPLLGGRARFVTAAAEATDLHVREADLAVLCNAIHLVPDKDGVVAAVSRALAPGGVFALNTSFYDGCYVPGTERFYRVWMLRAVQLLRDEAGLRPARGKSEAMRWWTAGEYVSCLQRHGFEVEAVQERPAFLTCASWRDVSRYREFAQGALPGVPLEIAVDVLQRSVDMACAELAIEGVERNWLYVVARRGA